MSEAFYCQTQDLAIGYGKTPLLQNIGIGVQRGQILALIGPNGAGKSTLLKTLAGQLAVQSGAVLLQGQNLTTAVFEVDLPHGEWFILSVFTIPVSSIA